MKERALDREACRLVNVKSGLPFLPPADVEVGYVHLVPRRELLEDVVVPGRDRVVDVVLGGDEEDSHGSCTLGIDWE